ncbi:MAG: hypothetical protein ACJ8F7_08295 [Gemmataceae bacterium]
MNVKLLGKLFGTDGRWSGPCTVIVDADADVQSISNDSIVQGGMKSFAPRLITGRVVADAVRLLPEEGALLLVRTTVIRQSTGEDIVKQSLQVVDVPHVAAVEFAGLTALANLGVPPPR